MVSLQSLRRTMKGKSEEAFTSLEAHKRHRQAIVTDVPPSCERELERAVASAQEACSQLRKIIR